MRDPVAKMADSFKALGDPTRLKLLRLLASASNNGYSLCVGALAERLGITQPAISQHLKVLKHVGLVEPHRAGFRVHYAIDTAELASYKDWIDELCQSTTEKCSPSKNCHKNDE